MLQAKAGDSLFAPAEEFAVPCRIELIEISFSCCWMGAIIGPPSGRKDIAAQETGIDNILDQCGFSRLSVAIAM